MALDYSNKFDHINIKIKKDIKHSFESFNEKNYTNIIPLSTIEIKNEVIKETSPLIFSLKNKINYENLKNQNEMEFFLLRNRKKREIKKNISYINDKINEINNEIKVLQDKNLFERISIKKNKDINSLNCAKLSEKAKLFLMYYKSIKKYIVYLEKNINEIIIKIKENNKTNDSNTNLLKDLKQNFEISVTSTRNILNEKLKEFNEIDKKSTDLNDIKKFKESLKLINKNIDEVIESKKFLENINKQKSYINKLKIKIENGILNRIKLLSKENKEIFKILLNNQKKFSLIKDKIEKNYQELKIAEEEIEGRKLSSLTKIIFDNRNIEIKREIHNLNENQNLMDYELKKLIENIGICESLLVNLTNKLEFYKSIKNIKKVLSETKDNILKKFTILEGNKNYYTKLVLENINSRKNKIDEIKKEKNLINSRSLEIQTLIEKNSANIEINKQYLIELNQNLINHNIILEKFNIINKKINEQKKVITELNAKIYEIENINKNLSIENIYYQNTFRKSINNYFFENQKQTNEMKRQKLLNKNTTINLFIYLDNIEKRIINNKKLILNKFGNFIIKQKEINKRCKEYIKYNNKIANKNKTETVKRIKSYKYIINNIIKKFILANENNKNIKKKLKNIQDLLKKNESEINDEFNKLKLYLNERIKMFNK